MFFLQGTYGQFIILRLREKRCSRSHGIAICTVRRASRLTRNARIFHTAYDSAHLCRVFLVVSANTPVSADLFSINDILRRVPVAICNHNHRLVSKSGTAPTVAAAAGTTTRGGGGGARGSRCYTMFWGVEL